MSGLKKIGDDAEDEDLLHDEENPFLAAAASGDDETLTKLLKEPDTNFSSVSKSGETALTLAAKGGHLQAVQILLAQKEIYDIAGTKPGETVLMWAAKNGYSKMVQALLLDPGVHINRCTSSGESALILAAKGGHLEVVRVFLAQKDIFTNTATESGETALTLAVQGGHLEVVHALLAQKGINADARTESGDTAITLAAKGGHMEIMKALLIHPNMNLNMRTKALESAEKLAEERDDEAMLNMLKAERGVKKDVTKEPCCPFCPTVSLIAIHNRHIQCLKTGLIECGSHPDACTMACRANRVDFLEILYLFNSPWTERTASTALSLGHFEALRFVLDRGCEHEIDIVHSAARIGNLPILTYLIEDLLLYMHEGGSVFGAAFEHAHLECLAYLVNQGCPFDLYKFPGPDAWPVFVSRSEKDSTFDTRLASCIIFAIDHNWRRYDSLIAFLDAHRTLFPCSVLYLQMER